MRCSEWAVLQKCAYWKGCLAFLASQQCCHARHWLLAHCILVPAAMMLASCLFTNLEVSPCLMAGRCGACLGSFCAALMLQ